MIDLPTGPDVFLGGTCGTSTWRQEIAIPRLVQEGVSFYNPQYPEGVWHTIPNLVSIEAEAKDNATQILVVIGDETRGTASIMEAAEWILCGSFVHLVIFDVPEGAIIDGRPLMGRDLRDANRPRNYLRNMVTRRRPHLPMHNSIEQAVEAVIGVARVYRSIKESNSP